MTKINFLLALSLAVLSCKKPTPASSVCSFKFSNNSKITFINTQNPLYVENNSIGFEKFEWYIDNNFITNTSQLSSKLLYNVKTNVKHELKLIGIDNSGNKKSFFDSFTVRDTFIFNEICVYNISKSFYDNITEDSNLLFAFNLEDVKLARIGITTHNPPGRTNLIPHVWGKKELIINNGAFFNRKALGSQHVWGSQENFYIDCTKMNDFIFCIYSYNKINTGYKQLSINDKIIQIKDLPDLHEMQFHTSNYSFKLR